MAELKTEYTDIKDNRHKVEHLIVSNEGDNSQEHIVEALFNVLAKMGKCVSA